MSSKTKLFWSVSALSVIGFASPVAAQQSDAAQAAPGTEVQSGPQDGTQSGDEIVVTGLRGSLRSAQDRKRTAAAVVDSIVAEDIGKFPDNAVSDALQRVTGVQVSRDRGEANRVLIRGLPNVSSFLNGAEVFTGTGRGVALQDIPAELVAGVDVYKTATPELIEGGVGGRIDIRLRRPFDFNGTTFAGSARAIYSDKREKWSYIGSGLASTRWESGGQEFGLLVGASYNKRRYRDQTAFNFGFNAFDTNPSPTVVNNVLIPDTVGGLITEGDRTRPALNASLQWRPNSSVEFYADALYTGYREDYDVNFFVGIPKWGDVTNVQSQGGTVTIPQQGSTAFPVAASITTLNNNTITSKQTFKQKTDGYHFLGGAKFDLGRAQIGSEVSYNNSKVSSRAYILDALFTVPRMNYEFNRDGTPRIEALTGTSAAFDLTNTSNLNLFALFDQRNLQRSKQLAWRGDVTVPFENSFLRNIKFGARLARRTGSSNGTGENRFGLAGSGNTYPGFGTKAPSADIMSDLGVNNFALPSTQFLRENIDLLRGLASRPSGPPSFAPTLVFTLKENNAAFYGQAGFDFADQGAPIDGIIGARVVKNKTRLDAFDIVNNVPQPTQRNRKETEILPSLTVKYRPTENVVVRLFAGETVMAPEFAQLNPATNRAPLGATGSSAVYGAGSGGNPDLASIKSRNFDLSAEYYFARTGYVSIAAFRRKLDGYIQQYADIEQFADPNSPNPTLLRNYSITRPRGTKGNLKGLELAYQQFYDFLPGPLSGLGLQANFTLSDGEVQDPRNLSRMQGITPLSKYSYNIIGMYEKYGFTARLAYNWRSKFIDFYDVNLPGGFNETASLSFLDFSASYDLNDKITLSVDATNLLNEEYHDYFGGNRITPRDTRLYDRTFGAGIRFKF